MKRLLLTAGLLIPLFGLSSPSAYGDVSVNIGIGAGPVAVHYWYYPDDDVYYDYDSHVYFYLAGGTWHRCSYAYLPGRYHHMGHHVIVESERGRPWARYEAHRAKYPPGQWKREDRDWGHREGHERHHHDDD